MDAKKQIPWHSLPSGDVLSTLCTSLRGLSPGEAEARLNKYGLNRIKPPSVIMAVVIINALIGFIQEGKAEQDIQAVSKILSLNATVIRDHNRITIPAET